MTDPEAECGGDATQCACPNGPLKNCLVNEWIGETQNERHADNVPEKL